MYAYKSSKANKKIKYLMKIKLNRNPTRTKDI